MPLLGSLLTSWTLPQAVVLAEVRCLETTGFAYVREKEKQLTSTVLWFVCFFFWDEMFIYCFFYCQIQGTLGLENKAG